MNYVSTRDKSVKVTAAKAIAQGISAEGGLFVPDTFSLFDAKDFEKRGAPEGCISCKSGAGPGHGALQGL